jgi:DNA mismatch endonuclease (patch repair protein)
MSASRSIKRKPLSKSEIMARIRSRDTRPEKVTRSVLHALGYRFRVHVRSLPGSPDIAVKRRKVAIFVHGCFWHLHDGCLLARMPKRNLEYWGPKLARNTTRDAAHRLELERLGFRVLVVWECETARREILAIKLDRFMEGVLGKQSSH